MQERLQLLCQRIDEHHDKLWKKMPDEKVLTFNNAEVKAKVTEAMRIMLDNRLERKEECYSQCGKLVLLVFQGECFKSAILNSSVCVFALIDDQTFESYYDNLTVTKSLDELLAHLTSCWSLKIAVNRHASNLDDYC